MDDPHNVTPALAARVRCVADRAVRPERDIVLYWMTSARRAVFNFSLERAVVWARELKRPLVVLEALRSGYEWASDRHHAFVVQGMLDNARAFRSRPVTYYPYVEASNGAGKGLLRALAARSCAVVTDEFPAFFLRRMLEAAAAQVDVRLEAVDSNGLIPVRAPDRAYPTAYAFRRFVHAYIAEHGVDMPSANPLARSGLPRLRNLPSEVTRRWRPLDTSMSPDRIVAALPIDHSVPPAPFHGGGSAARRRLRAFIGRGLGTYETDRNDPDADAGSGLSPYLHFGHIGSQEIVDQIVQSGVWSPDDVAVGARGSRAGWGGLTGVAALLDQLITWRELSFNTCVHLPNYDAYDSLPAWALTTLAEHAGDPREPVYSQSQLDAAETHDALWNAAQRQLRLTGALHNYLRMLWGKKILEWTESSREALEVMVQLNNRYAVDGRDPNSYAGIFWILGRYDRPWGPERPVFGKVRYMSSANTRRKYSVDRYLRRYGTDGPAAVR